MNNRIQINHTFKLGYVLSLGTRLFGVLIFITSVVGFLYGLKHVNTISFIFSLVMIVLSTLMMTYKNGVDISKSSNKIRAYSSLIGLKYGKWKTYENYTDLVILTSRTKSNMTGNAGGINNLSSPLSLDLSYQNKSTNIYLMTPNHRHKLLLKICKNKAEADQLISTINSGLNKKISTYNPKISEKTKARKFH